MRRLKAQGIPVVAVMITGRPLYVNPALNAADAFVVAWLPGSEGAGLADVLVGGATARRTSTSWASCRRVAADRDHGRRRAVPVRLRADLRVAAAPWTALPENAGAGAAGDSRTFLAAGRRLRAGRCISSTRRSRAARRG
jgi:beta-glucosidase